MSATPGILGVKNRSENWRTAQAFAPLLAGGTAHLLANKLLPGRQFLHDEVHLELFWRGVRDVLHDLDGPRRRRRQDAQRLTTEITELYAAHFSDLRECIGSFRVDSRPGFLPLDEGSYGVPASREGQVKFYYEMQNTEIDVVLSAPGYLLIGEMKSESSFGASRKNILVHQLIREYVMAKIAVLLRPAYESVAIVSFVIGEKEKKRYLHSNKQVRFLVAQGWLTEDNILSWSDLKQWT
ncbi:MAG: hypothetical protein HY533_02585 [Chloroflexi bacterium]|nr:hypothetical protein [Chloroflexota bacterium]